MVAERGEQGGAQPHSCAVQFSKHPCCSTIAVSVLLQGHLSFLLHCTPVVNYWLCLNWHHPPWANNSQLGACMPLPFIQGTLSKAIWFFGDRPPSLHIAATSHCYPGEVC